MSSNPSGPASPFNAAEAEELAAQFRPVWDVDGTIPPPTAPSPPEPPTPPAAPAVAGSPAVSVPNAKPTVRWAPGSTPQGFPAPAPPAPLPAPAPRKRREAPTPEVRELTGEEKGPVSSDGSVAMAVTGGPVLPPKAAEVTVPQEPSIVVKDVVATAHAVANEESRRKEEEQRRRQTVRLGDIRKDPALAEMYAKYESVAIAEAAEAKASAVSKGERRNLSAPLPVAEDSEIDTVFPDTTKNRKIVFGVLGIAVLLMLVGIVKATLSPDQQEPSPTAETSQPASTKVESATTKETEPKAKEEQPQAAPPNTTAEHKAAATVETTQPKATANPPVVLPTPPAATSKKEIKTENKATKASPPTHTSPPSPAGKPATKGQGGIIRDVPF